MSDIQRYRTTYNGQTIKDCDGWWVQNCDYLEAIEAKDKEIENLNGQYKTLDIGFDKSLQINATQTKEIERLKRAVESVFELIDESDGVSGFHQNGEIIYWCSLLRGGQFEEWLSPLSEVQELTK